MSESCAAVALVMLPLLPDGVCFPERRFTVDDDDFLADSRRLPFATDVDDTRVAESLRLRADFVALLVPALTLLCVFVVALAVTIDAVSVALLGLRCLVPLDFDLHVLLEAVLLGIAAVDTL